MLPFPYLAEQRLLRDGRLAMSRSRNTEKESVRAALRMIAMRRANSVCRASLPANPSAEMSTLYLNPSWYAP